MWIWRCFCKSHPLSLSFCVCTGLSFPGFRRFSTVLVPRGGRQSECLLLLRCFCV
jgi:hypothetical protein